MVILSSPSDRSNSWMNILDGKITFDKDSTVFCKSCSLRPVVTIGIAAPDNVVTFRLKAKKKGVPPTQTFICTIPPGDYLISDMAQILETALNVGTGLETAIDGKTSINYYYASWRVANVLDSSNNIIGFKVQNYTSRDPYDPIDTPPASLIECTEVAGITFPSLQKSKASEAWDSV